jgi:hypothetical protein
MQVSNCRYFSSNDVLMDWQKSLSFSSILLDYEYCSVWSPWGLLSFIEHFPNSAFSNVWKLYDVWVDWSNNYIFVFICDLLVLMIFFCIHFSIWFYLFFCCDSSYCVILIIYFFNYLFYDFNYLIILFYSFLISSFW